MLNPHKTQLHAVKKSTLAVRPLGSKSRVVEEYGMIFPYSTLWQDSELSFSIWCSSLWVVPHHPHLQCRTISSALYFITSLCDCLPEPNPQLCSRLIPLIQWQCGSGPYSLSSLSVDPIIVSKPGVGKCVKEGWFSGGDIVLCSRHVDNQTWQEELRVECGWYILSYICQSAWDKRLWGISHTDEGSRPKWDMREVLFP